METRTGLVSILMPVYNGERFLRQAVESVLAQEYPHWELLFADDGSTDATRSIIVEYADPRIRYLHQPNGGQASALNLGLRHAEGEFITTLDADDWMPPASLAERVAYLQAHPEFGAVYSNGIYCAEDGATLAHFSDYCLTNVTGDVYDSLIVSNMFGTGAAVLIRHEHIQRLVLTYDEQIIWCQDWDFYLRLAEQITFGYIDTLAVNYRLHASNMTMQMTTERQRKSTIRTRQKVMASSRFEHVPVDKVEEFFYSFLLVDLGGQTAEQKDVVSSKVFANLPVARQARLVRLVANDYLLKNADRKICQEWLRLARAINPRDHKTFAVSLLFDIYTDLAKRAVRIYRHERTTGQRKTPLHLIER
jgi:glycosyltransferase involved in cell wall biosynthesis